MTRYTVHLVIASALLAVGVFAFVQPASAHKANTASQLRAAGVGKACHVLRVHLNGSQPASSTCLYPTLQDQKAVSPYTLSRFCQNTDLHIYQDANFSSSGDLICFYGTGFVNLSDYYIITFIRDWDDEASSWKGGIWIGRFYSDPNGSGQLQRFAGGQGNFDGANGHLHNDTLSSIFIDGIIM